jgi:AcrR family transcriptional regulator
MENSLSSRQMEILISTVRLIKEGGLNNVTVKNIAKKTHITDGAIYKHFESKEEILVRTMEMARSDILNVTYYAREKSRSAVEALENIYRDQAAFFEKNPAYVIILLFETSVMDFKVLKLILSNINKEIKKFVNDIIREGQKNATIRSDISSEQLSFMYISLLHNCINQWYLEDGKKDISKQCMKMWNTLLLLFRP